MYQIKCIPEDFVVREIMDVRSVSGAQERNIAKKWKSLQGRFIYFCLQKRNFSTPEALEMIARAAGVRVKDIGCAGNKDKRAVTIQYCSAPAHIEKRLRTLRSENIAVTVLGFAGKPISLGDHRANAFEIIVRNLTKKEAACAAEKIKNKKKSAIPNYFDEQRFSKGNVKAGLALLHRNFGHACRLIGKTRAEVIGRLAEKRNDFIGALRIVPKRILLLYLHSVQSFLFNEIAAQYLKTSGMKLSGMKCTGVRYSLGKLVFPVAVEKCVKRGMKKGMVKGMLKCVEKIPLVGFGTEIRDKEIEKITLQLLRKHNLQLHDFIIRPIPVLSSEGDERMLFFVPEKLTIGESVKDELHPGKWKVNIGFTLPKGSYATIVVKWLFG